MDPPRPPGAGRRSRALSGHHVMDGILPAALSVSRFETADAAEWDRFVRGAPGGTFFHLSVWRRVIEQAFGHDTHYLVARRGGVLSGVLPLTHLRSPLFGQSLIANAFAVYGGPVASDEETLCALDAAALQLMERLNVPFLEMRGSLAHRRDWHDNSGLYATFRRPIEPSVEANLKAVPRKQRAMIRKGIQNGLRSEIDPGSTGSIRSMPRACAISERRSLPKRIFACWSKNSPIAATLSRSPAATARWRRFSTSISATRCCPITAAACARREPWPPMISCIGRSCGALARKAIGCSISAAARPAPAPMRSNAIGGLPRAR